ncbi:cobN/Magnesium Chelatase family protein [Mycobacterium xenopi 3993]|nr:cobN/Magnesium Chelatase family protein [Mycobacterium xenopi 3993]
MVHLGKHGNLEWLPGKTLGLSAACAADAALGNLPLVYPFLVNDPGEGTQAKRRAHAVLVDHLIPPMARAETYGDIARLEQLLDEHAAVAALDPDKLPAIRQQIWTLIRAAKMDHDLGLTERRKTTRSTRCCCTSTDGCARSRMCRFATACTSWVTSRPEKPN